jgi:hypothetical protein
MRIILLMVSTINPEPVLLNVYGATELIPRNEFRQPKLGSMYPGGRYENPIPPRCLAPIDFLKIPAQYFLLVGISFE